MNNLGADTEEIRKSGQSHGMKMAERIKAKGKKRAERAPCFVIGQNESYMLPRAKLAPRA